MGCLLRTPALVESEARALICVMHGKAQPLNYSKCYHKEMEANETAKSGPLISLLSLHITSFVMVWLS